MSLLNFNIDNTKYLRDFSSSSGSIGLSSYGSLSSGNIFNLYNTLYSKPVLKSNSSIWTSSQNRKLLYNTGSSKILPSLKEAGYNAKKGNRLASIAAQNAKDFTGQCATYVKNAIQEAGMGKYIKGDAYECANILKRNKENFKEISTKGLDLSSLPKGCALVYDRGVSNYSSDSGHIEITLGNGKAARDGITNNIRPGARVFIPV